MIPLGPRRLVIATLLAQCTGCTYPTDDGRLKDVASQRFQLVRTVPPAGALHVSPGAPVDLLFDAPPDADTVVTANVRVFSGLIETAGTVKADLLDRRVRFTPTRPLRTSLRHQVYVHHSLAGLNGVELGQTVVFDFTTGEADRRPPAPEPEQVTASSLQGLWDGQCRSCHGPPGPPASLDLSTPTAALGSLKGVPSSYGNRVRVAPGAHAKSYLMLKLLGAGGYVGFPMPPDGPQLPRDDLRRIASWIDGGASP